MSKKISLYVKFKLKIGLILFLQFVCFSLAFAQKGLKKGSSSKFNIEQKQALNAAVTCASSNVTTCTIDWDSPTTQSAGVSPDFFPTYTYVLDCNGRTITVRLIRTSGTVNLSTINGNDGTPTSPQTLQGAWLGSGSNGQAKAGETYKITYTENGSPANVLNADLGFWAINNNCDANEVVKNFATNVSGTTLVWTGEAGAALAVAGNCGVGDGANAPVYDPVTNTVSGVLDVPNSAASILNAGKGSCCNDGGYMNFQNAAGFSEITFARSQPTSRSNTNSSAGFANGVVLGGDNYDKSTSQFCVACSSTPLPAPVLTSSTPLKGICPTNAHNLTSRQPIGIANTTYEWHTVASNPTAADLIANPELYTGSGPVYMYKKVAGCISTASAPLTLVASECGTSGACSVENLEFTAGAGNPTGVGPVSTATATFQNNTNNIAGNTFASSANPVSMTIELSNKTFGAGSFVMGSKLGNGSLIFPLFNDLGGSTQNSDFTTVGPGNALSQGIDIGTNRGLGIAFNTFNIPTGFSTAAGARFFVGDMNMTFSQPIDNPIVHFVDFGGTYNCSLPAVVKNFTLEYELIAPASVTQTKLSGGAGVTVSGANINNSGMQQSASIRINSTGLSELKYKVYIKAFTAGTWASCNILPSENMIFSVSVPNSKPGIPLPTVNNLTPVCPNKVLNLTTIQPAAVAGTTYEWHTAATDPTAATLIANPGTYSGNGPVYLYSKADGTGCYSLGSQVTITVVECRKNVSGNVFNDVNAGNVDGIGTNAGGLFANLIGSNGLVYKTVAVQPDGSFLFSLVDPNSGYTVQISTNQGASGMMPPAQTLPNTWVNTGDFNGMPGTGTNPSSINGVSESFAVVTTDVTNINFGIEQLPTPNVTLVPTQPNPGGVINVPIGSNFGGTDPTPGIITSLRITEFPTNTTSIKIGSTTCTDLACITTAYPNGIPTDPMGVPTVSILLDPTDGTVTSFIPYKVTDNAGKESPTEGSVTVPFYTASVSGNVYNDVNGITDNTVNGVTPPTGLYASLLNGSTVVATQPIKPDGTYKFDNVTPGSYSVLLSTNPGVPDSPAPTVALPANWVTTGENNGLVGTDGTPDSKSNVFPVSSTDVVNINFGLEELPTPVGTPIPSQPNPNGTIFVPITSGFAGTDPTPGIVKAIEITSFPPNVTTIKIGMTSCTDLACITTAYPNGIPTSPTGVPTVPIEIDPVDGNITVVVPFKVIDDAGKKSPGTSNVTAPFTTVKISGNVYNDVNGITDNTVNGGTPPTGLYATLLNGNIVVSTVPVNPDGTYTINNVSPGNYSVILSTNPGVKDSPAPTVALPANWVTTGENNGLVGTDGTPDSKSNVFPVSSIDVVNINFGLEELPTPVGTPIPSQPNPNGTVFVPITSGFAGTDPTPGIVKAIEITSFPPNVTTIKIGTTSCTDLACITTAYPNGIPTSPTGVPTVPIEIDPVDGNITVVVPFKVIDDAGKKSPTTSNVTAPFTTVKITGNVYNDVNGITDNTVNGGTPPTGLYATLLSGNTVVSTVPVNLDGTYTINNVSPGNYSVILSTNPGVKDSPPPTVALPANWVTTGENNGLVGTDGTPDSKSNVFPVSATDIVNINFGLEELPTPVGTPIPSQPNPNGTVFVPITSGFAGTDPTPGIVKAIEITSFPPNVTTIKIGTTSCTDLACITTAYPNGIPTSPTGVPTVPIEIDPVDGNITVVVPFKVIDDAGKKSPTTSNVTAPFTTVTVEGNVFHDNNGLFDDKVNSTSSAPIPTGLVANLLNGAGTIVVATVPVNADGTFKFENVSPSNYVVQITTTAGVKGNAAPTTSLPMNWVNTGENNDLPTISGNDGTVDGKSAPFSVNNKDITNINFGIEQPPVATDVNVPPQLNPGGPIKVPVPLAVSDPDDVPPTTITITTVPTGGTVTYDNTPITVGTPIPNFDPSKLKVDPNPGDVTVTFKYTTTDKPGKESPPATVNMPFTTLNLSGSVFKDPNGASDMDVNGTKYTVGDLKANLVDNATNLVIATVPVDAMGNYKFTSLSPGSYTVQISTVTGMVGSAFPTQTLPGTYVNTGDEIVTTQGTTPNGVSETVTLVDADKTEVNFGIEQPPVAPDVNVPSQPNPGGVVKVPVPTLPVTDPDDVPPTTITITTVPTGGTVTYDNTPITVGTPIPNFDPSKLKVDPGPGDVTVTFKYTTTDKAGKESPPGTVNMPFFTLNIAGSVFKDPNGATDMDVNGTKYAVGDLKANLVDNATNLVIATVPVDAMGDYKFTSLSPGSYTVQISTVTGMVGSAFPTQTLPGTFVNTGDEIVATQGTTPNGVSETVTLVDADKIEVNFGIEQPPVAPDVNVPSQPNPGGVVKVSVPTLPVTDPDDVPPTTITITTVPTGGTVTYDNTPITVGTPIPNFDPSKLKVDPGPGDVTVTFKYTTTDKAGKESPPGTVNMPFTTLNIAGSVFIDPNGASDMDVNGTKYTVGDLKANLVDNATNLVIATVPVDAMGNYKFTSLSPGSYTVQISTVTGMVGSAFPTQTLPVTFVNTGDEIVTTQGITPNGVSETVTLVDADKTEVNFGIEQPPVAPDVNVPSQPNPGGVVKVPVPPLNVTDPDDVPPTTITITTVPTGGTVTYDDTPIIVGTPIPNFDPSKLKVDPGPGDVTVTFKYTTTDKAGKESPPATVNMPFEVCELEISGTVFLDTDGPVGVNSATGLGIDGTTIGTTGLHMTLMEGATQKDVQPISATGTYKFTNVAAGTYTLVLSTTANGSAMALLPNTHVFVSEGGNLVGGVAQGDGTPDGKTTITADCKAIIRGVNLRPNVVVSYANNDFGIKLNPNPLPVELITFDAKQLEEQVSLSWKVANEKEFSHFEVQRSENAKEFGALGKVNGSKSSIYSFVDSSPIEGINYYRLKMVDLDGSAKLSKVISLNFEKGKSFIIVENPAKGSQIKVITNLQNPRFVLLNTLGAKVEANITESANNIFDIKTKDLATGIYYLNIESNGRNQTRKVLIQK